MRTLLVMLWGVFMATGCFAEEMDVCFSPNGGCQQAIVDQISRSRETMDIAMYFLTSREIAQALVKARNRQVRVRLVFDKSQAIQTYAKAPHLIKQGFEVRYHTGDGLMHNKFAIIDGHLLITGSFNWTPTADHKNEENLLIVKDAAIIKKYQERFDYLWGQAREGAIKKESGLRGWICSVLPGLCGE